MKLSYEKTVLHPQVDKLLDLSVMSLLPSLRPQLSTLLHDMGNILVSQHTVNQILVSLLWLCPFGRRHSSSL